MFKCITLILKDCLCYHRRQKLFAPKAVKTYFRRQKVADEVQIQQVSELLCCGVVSGFMRRVWRGRFQTHKQKVSNTALLSCLLVSKKQQHTHKRLTPACVVDQAVDVTKLLHCDCNQPLQRQEEPTNDKYTSAVNAGVTEFSEIIMWSSCDHVTLSISDHTPTKLHFTFMSSSLEMSLLTNLQEPGPVLLSSASKASPAAPTRHVWSFRKTLHPIIFLFIYAAKSEIV